MASTACIAYITNARIYTVNRSTMSCNCHGNKCGNVGCTNTFSLPLPVPWICTLGFVVTSAFITSHASRKHFPPPLLLSMAVAASP